MLTKEYLECLLDYCQLQNKSGALIDGLSPGVMIEIIMRLIQAEKDAARYRWLRCQHDKEDDTVSIFINDEQHGAGHLDSQVDEAMNASNN